MRAAVLLALAAAGEGAAAAAGSGAPPPDAPPDRLVLIALDAVPYRLVAELSDPARGEAALFQGFPRPAALVSSFPSTTSVAMSGLLAPLGMASSPGYEARYFDWERRRLRGGGPISYFRLAFPWRTFFDFDKKGPAASFFAALRPVAASLAGLRQAFDALLAAEQATFLIYIGDTDLIAHLKSPDALATVLAELERLLAGARRRTPDRPFRTVLFSDHGIAGGAPLVNVWGAVREGLAAAGLRARERLTGPSTVTLSPFGLVSSFEIYAWPGEEAAVARAAARVAGVELCACRDGGGYRVEGPHGAARFEARRGPEGERLWRYAPQSGDPLRYLPLAAALAARPGARGDGFHPDAWWLEASAGTVYPDALHRLARAFDVVANPASVACSLAPGFMFGGRGAELGARLPTAGGLAWTHGALESEASLGFLLTDVPGWSAPAAVRFDEALAPFVAAAAAPGGPQMAALPRARRQPR